VKKIEIDTFFGDKPVHIEISAPMGTGGATYFIVINKGYCGRIWKTEHYGWRHDLSPTSQLTGDDLQILIDLIEEDLMNRKSSYFSKCFAAAYSFAFPISLKKFQNPANEISFIRRIKNKSMTAIWNNPQSCFWNILIHLPGAGYRNDTIIVPMND